MSRAKKQNVLLWIILVLVAVLFLNISGIIDFSVIGDKLQAIKDVIFPPTVTEVAEDNASTYWNFVRSLY